jgi:hypothetical protein
MHIYVFGNGNISFTDFIHYYQQPLSSYLSNYEVSFSVGDYKGVDTLVMELLKRESSHVTVYHVGERPRYLPDKYKAKVSSWKLIGRFETDEARDLAAIESCSHYLAVDVNSDEQRKSGTLKNIELCQAKNKKSLSVHDSAINS